MINYIFLLGLSGLLGGYAILGRGFAYLGAPPLFVGEMVLALGLVAALSGRSMRRVFRCPPAWPLLLLLLWCCARTIPYLSEFGADALRDGAQWGYGVFAFTVAAAITSKKGRLAILLLRYERFIPIFLASAPLVWVVGQYQLLPITAPGTEIPLISQRPGFALVHLGGLIAFGLVRLGRVGQVSWALAAAMFLLMASSNRAGLLSVLMAISVVVIFKPWTRRLWRVAAVFVVAITLFMVVNPTIPTGRAEREVSRDQLISSVVSIFGDDVESGDLQDTKVWRLAWWGTIVSYTLLGDYFWMGKGFGINLADDDGFQVVENGPPLRSPHNGHLTFLARAGVPGFVLWILAQGLWAGGMVRSIFRARKLGARQWERLFIFLLAYWLAQMTTSAFDVYLEGPMGGIWFWSVFGVGLAALEEFRHGDAATQEAAAPELPLERTLLHSGTPT